jgi:hypothetical protein
MQMNDAKELSNQWGTKPCDHPNFAREYFLGANTGEYVCTQCGQAFTDKEVAVIKANRPK